MTIDDLSDDLLRDILCSLPCYRTALRCKSVSKRWCSIISDPFFVTQGFLTHCEVIEKESSLAALLTMWSYDKINETTMVAPSYFQRTLCTPFLTLEFLPCHSTPVAAFKDLILSFGVNPSTYLGVFYICNPLTKQWIVLPPSQSQLKPVIWATLICMKGCGFRVVVAHSEPKLTKKAFVLINLFVYISETCQWKNIEIRVNLQRSIGVDSGEYFRGVVCKSMVCIHYSSYFGAFNPFDVTDTLQGTLTAIDLPLPVRKVELLLESEGKLVAFEVSFVILMSDPVGKSAKCVSSTERRIWKLDMRLNNDKQLPQWELISQLDDGHINVKGSIFTPYDDVYNILAKHSSFDVVGVHPSKEHLVYLSRNYGGKTQNRLILYDTKSKTIEPLTTTILPQDMYSIPHDMYSIHTFHKLDIPCWPTPLPMP